MHLVGSSMHSVHHPGKLATCSSTSLHILAFTPLKAMLQ